MSNKKVLAKVNDVEITDKDVDRFLVDIGPQMAAQFQSEEGRKRIVEELVNQELLLLDAKAKKLDETEEYKELLIDTEDKLLKSFALTKLLQDVKVTEEGLKNYYEENKANYKKPETAIANHILVESEEEAIKILEEIKGGLSFADAASKYSLCPSKDVGGNLGEFARGQMVPEFEEVAFSMEVGTLSDPVKTQFGYHIIELIEKKPEGIQTFEELKPVLEENYLRLKQQEKYLQRIFALNKEHKVEIY